MKTTIAQRAPTPLIDLYDGAENPKDAQFLVDRLGISQVKAAFICKAVNAHGELVASLKEYKAAATNGTEVTLGMALRSAAAIAKAEAL